MNGFRAIALKELRLLARDPMFLALELVCPLLLLAVFGAVLSVTLRATPVAVADRDRSAASRALVAELAASATFQPIDAEPALALARGEVVAGLEILPGFGRGRGGEPRALILVDGSDGAAAGAAAALAQVLGERLATDELTSLVWYNPERDDALFFIPGVVALILFAGAAIFPALSLAREKDSRAWATLAATPVSDAALLAGKLVPYLGQTALIAAACLAAAHLAFGVPCRGPVAVLALGTGLFLAASIALGAAIAALSVDENQTWRHLQLAVLLPGFVLSGFVYPLASMPAVAELASRALPARAYLELLRGVMLKGAGLADAAQPLAALAVFAVTFCAAAAALLGRARRAAA